MPFEIWEGQRWQHSNGNIYEVLMFTNTQNGKAEKYPLTVVYRNVDNGMVYSRRADDWHRSMTLIDPRDERITALEEALQRICNRIPAHTAEHRRALKHCAEAGMILLNKVPQ